MPYVELIFGFALGTSFGIMITVVYFNWLRATGRF